MTTTKYVLTPGQIISLLLIIPVIDMALTISVGAGVGAVAYSYGEEIASALQFNMEDPLAFGENLEYLQSLLPEIAATFLTAALLTYFLILTGFILVLIRVFRRKKVGKSD